MKLIGDSLCGSIRCILTKISENMAKPWPKLGYKRKKILLFHSFKVTCKISLVPGTGTPELFTVKSNYL